MPIRPATTYLQASDLTLPRSVMCSIKSRTDRTYQCCHRETHNQQSCRCRSNRIAHGIAGWGWPARQIAVRVHPDLDALARINWLGMFERTSALAGSHRPPRLHENRARALIECCVSVDDHCYDRVSRMCLLGTQAITRAIDSGTHYTGDRYFDKQRTEREQHEQGFDAVGAPKQRIEAKNAADLPAARKCVASTEQSSIQAPTASRAV
jgi:hypothetical protein